MLLAASSTNTSLYKVISCLILCATINFTISRAPGPPPILNDESILRGFNQVLGHAKNFRIRKPGVLELDFDTEPRIVKTHPQHTITMTDNESYAFFSSCWTETQDRGWMVYATKPDLGDEALKRIEKEAERLGYDPSKFAFMKRANCIEYKA